MSRRLLTVLFLTAAAQFLGGCSVLGTQFGYYRQSILGHLHVMHRSRPISEWLDDEDIDDTLRERLHRVLAMREFAIDSLQLPDNGSYLDYADLERAHVVWNVFATPELSLQPLQYCFPFVGCLDYRGYYEQAEAEAEATGLQKKGYDVFVGGVDAYSTLGWFADPVLNTMLRWPEPQLASVLFHEMAHQKVYADDDSAYNEAFATAVADIGVEHWLKAQGEHMTDWEKQSRRQHDFVMLVSRTAQRLRETYRSKMDASDIRAAKQEILESMRAEYRELRDRDWHGYAGYDAWFAKVNNARIAAVSTYHRWVPAFRQALRAQGGDLGRFYAVCEYVAGLSPADRQAWLQAHLTSGDVQAGR